MKEFIHSKPFKITAIVIGLVILVLVSFASGVAVGFRKARFSYAWGANYERNFMGPRGGGGPFGMMRDFEGRDFRNAHGLTGTILSINDNNIVVKDRDNKENTVNITDKTIIKQGPDTIKISDLKPDLRVVVMGNPDDQGVIKAVFIRVFNNNINNPNQSN